MIDGGATLARRLDRYRSAIRAPTRDGGAPPPDDLAGRLATAVDGEIVRTSDGVIVRVETPSRAIPVDRALLATLPGQPPANVPLVCLDTETTGLATAAGTLAWLIGVGWWEADCFRQVQLLLPDNGEERCLLAALEATIPASAWLVTYNGRGFDWPLLVARYRLARRAAPVHAGHLDLLPVVRRLFRHRMADARLRTAEAELLGLHRVGDVEGWEIPGRSLEFLRGGPAGPLVDIVRHNDQDVRSLARLLMMIAHEYATPEARLTVPIGDLGGLATAYAREGRLDEALACYDVAIRSPAEPPPPLPTVQAEPRRATGPSGDLPWWSPRVAADFGGPRPTPIEAGRPIRASTFASSWTPDRIAFERAHLLRRLKRWDEAVEAWTSLAAGPGRAAIVAAIELAKIREHRLRDPLGALHVAADALEMIERRKRRGRPEPRLEADLLARSRRLRRRLARRDESPPRPIASGAETSVRTPARP
jgi:tetratricopeptide (TPR) repeat protein